MSSSDKTLEKGFWLIITALAFVVTGIFGYFVQRVTTDFDQMGKKMDLIAESVVKLNTKIAVVIQQGNGRDKTLDDHEIRLRIIEDKD